MANNGVNLNPGAYTIYSRKLNDYRKELLKQAQNKGPQVFQAENIAGFLAEQKDEGADHAELLQKQAEFLETLGMVNAGRGVNKAQFTPAEYSGINVKNPNFFGVQPKEPVPYAQMITNRNNLEAVVKGFQENMYEQYEGNEGTSMAQVLRKSRLIGEAFDRQKQNSIYANVPKDPEVNLYNIKQRNRRMNSIYALS